MSALRSSVLIVGHPQPDENATGAEFVHSYQEAASLVQQDAYGVIAFDGQKSEGKGRDVFFEALEKNQKMAQKVLVHHDLNFSELQKLSSTLGLFKVLNGFEEPLFQQTLQEALEAHALRLQEEQLSQLVHEQNERLKKLSIDLEKRVEKRHKYLLNARKKLLVSNERVEALHKALVAVHHAGSVSELETSVNDALQSTLKLSWTRILFEWQNVLARQNTLSQKAFEIFSAPIIRGKELVGQIYFAREKADPFKKDEHGFLIQVADAVTLAIDRLYRFEETQTLKRQWEATFDAITTPVSLISESHELVRCNKAFAEKAGQPMSALIGKKCYQSLFQRDRPCERCHLGEAFRLTPQKTASGDSITFEVSTQALSGDEQEPLFVTFYRDISEQLQLQRHVVESAKMAELGTIGSSIAHELNNPLGGMISFLQLIKADLKGDEDFYQDIEEMEKGAASCKEIVQNLLHFSRLPSVDSQGRTDLLQIIERAIKITELQTKSKGIEILFEHPEEEVMIVGQYHLLTQALRHLLQFSITAISDEMKNRTDFLGNISLSLRHEIDVIVFEIKTNTPYPRPKSGSQKKNTLQELDELPVNAGLDLSITEQIILEHSGTLEIIAPGENFFLVKVSLPRLSTYP